MRAKRKGFFAVEEREEDKRARQEDLAALITTKRTVPQNIGVDRIEPNPYQARTNFDAAELAELAEAIRVQGFTSRLRVRPNPTRPGYFQLVYGERRLRAARLAGLTDVPCDVAEHTDDELIDIGLAENIQRKDLSPVEEARAFQQFIEQRNLSVRTLAERIGKPRSYIEDRLVLLRVPPDVREMVDKRPDTLRAARELSKIESPEERKRLIDRVIAGDLNIRGVREEVQELAPAATREKEGATRQRRSSRDRLLTEIGTVTAITARWEGALASLEAEETDDLRSFVHDALVPQVHALLDSVERLITRLQEQE